MGAMPVYVVNMPGGGFGGDMGDVGSSDSKRPSKSNKPSSRFFSMKGLASATTVGYGLSMVPDFSPVKIRRASDVDTSQLPEGFPVQPGFLDVIDEFKSWFSSQGGNAGVSDNAYLSGNSGNVTLKVEVSDDRVKVTPTYAAPGIIIDPDTGTN